jgi:hypothetical protein
MMTAAPSTRSAKRAATTRSSCLRAATMPISSVVNGAVAEAVGRLTNPWMGPRRGALAALDGALRISRLGIPLPLATTNDEGSANAPPCI